MKTSLRLISQAALLLVAVAGTAQALADRGEDGHGPAHYDRGGYYPAPGRRYPAPPHGAMPIPYHAGGPYYYHQGSWYHHDGSSFVVVLPPIGLVAPFLPPFYSTFWVGGYPYYYANNVYYAWQPQAQGYVVTQPPPTANATVATPGAELFIYPAKGQSESQQATDRYECHAWSVNETGFDPVKPQGGVDEANWAQKREDYQRAIAACLSARGYSVR